MDSIFSYLSSLTITPTLQSDVESAWLFLKSSITFARDNFVPIRYIPATTLPKWFDAGLRHKLCQVRTLRCRVNKAPHASEYLIHKLQHMESQLQLDIVSAKKRFLSRISSQYFSQPKILHSYLSSLKNSPTIPQSVHLSCQSASDPQSRTTLFNNYFNSVFTKSDFLLPPLKDLPSPSSQLHHISISSTDVLNSLNTLKLNKAPGVDDLSPSIIKLCFFYQSPASSQTVSCTTRFPRNGKLTRSVLFQKVGTPLLSATTDPSPSYVSYLKC